MMSFQENENAVPEEKRAELQEYCAYHEEWLIQKRA